MNYKKTQLGRSMIETMGYITVAITLVISVSKLATSAYTSYKSSKAVTQLSNLATKITKLGAIDVNYGDAITALKGGNGSTISPVDLPDGFRRKGGNIYNAYGHPVTIAKADLFPKKFSITYTDLNYEECIELATINWELNHYTSLYYVNINDITWSYRIYLEPNNSTVFELPVKYAAVAGTEDDDGGQCNNEEGASNTIKWVFN